MTTPRTRRQPSAEWELYPAKDCSQCGAWWLWLPMRLIGGVWWLWCPDCGEVQWKANTDKIKALGGPIIYT